MDNIPYGYCHCGCGQKTKLAPRTNSTKGWIKGQPLRYIRYHKPSVHTLYEEDRGFDTPCHIWKGRLTFTGYGIKDIRDRSGRKNTIRAHRWVWELTYGAVPAGHVLHHLCQVRSCCNPAHLELIARGEHISAHHSQLTKEDKDYIRLLYRHSPLRGKDIARYFGISQAHVSKIALDAGIRRRFPHTH